MNTHEGLLFEGSIESLGHDFTGIPTTEESWCRLCGEEDHVIKTKMVRCVKLIKSGEW